MRTNQYEIANSLANIFEEVVKLRRSLRTGYYDRDDAIKDEIDKVLVALDDAVAECNYADYCDNHYHDVDPCEAAKVAAERKWMMAQ